MSCKFLMATIFLGELLIGRGSGPTLRRMYPDPLQFCTNGTPSECCKSSTSILLQHHATYSVSFLLAVQEAFHYFLLLCQAADK
jgi:hypothetical protein